MSCAVRAGRCRAFSSASTDSSSSSGCSPKFVAPPSWTVLMTAMSTAPEESIWSSESSSSCVSENLLSTTASGSGSGGYKYFRSHVRVQARDWMYWQRDPRNAHSWTKVFCVLEEEFLWVYQHQTQVKSLLFQLAVSHVQVTSKKIFVVVDPNQEQIQLSVYQDAQFPHWRKQLVEASRMTTLYLQRFAKNNVKNLPKSSMYRGSLAAYRKEANRLVAKAKLRGFLESCKSRVQMEIPL